MKRHLRVQGVGLALLLMASAHTSAAGLKVKVLDSTGQPARSVAVLVDAAAEPGRVPARQPVEIRQKNLRFIPALTVVPVGTELRFTNEDEFDHHVMGASANTRFEFFVPAGQAAPPSGKNAKRAKRTPASVVLAQAGTVSLSCHLHASMRGHVLITQAPFHGVTDANGEIDFAGLEAGPATVSVWHPLLLTPPTASAVDVTPAGAEQTIRLSLALPGTGKTR